MTDSGDERTKRFYEWNALTTAANIIGKKCSGDGGGGVSSNNSGDSSSGSSNNNGIISGSGCGDVVVGKGNYGTVYRYGDGAVVKVVPEIRKSAGSAKLAYREHVMSLLQTVLVLRRHTPHLPIHYGLESCHNGPKSLSMKLYIEAFDCSLDAAKPECLSKTSDWVAIIFQISSAVLCVAKLLGVCHNDLYPRNVLIRRHCNTSSTTITTALPQLSPPPSSSLQQRRYCCYHYNHFGERHTLCWHSLAALTDFGVCSGSILASKSGPEVKRTPVVQRSETVPFGQQPPGLHVLNHTYLPQFSRDPYLLFKWGVFNAKGLPCRPPKHVTAWCKDVLHYIDTHQAAFTRPDATLRLFAYAFCPETLARHSLALPVSTTTVVTSDNTNNFSVSDSDRTLVLNDCTSLLSAVPFSPSS